MGDKLNSVEIFSVGTWNGMKFTQEDLQEIAENTNLLLTKGTNKPPIKIGHSSNQIMKGQSDGDPALGWIDNIRVSGKKLVADFMKVPNILVRAFKEGLYRQVSVEMKHLQDRGWFLTGLAVLGADLPAVKNLSDLELFLSERTGLGNPGDSQFTLQFSAIEPVFLGNKLMDKEEMSDISELQAKLDKLESENKAFKEREKDTLFSSKKSEIMSSYDQDVKDGKLAPAFRDKIAATLDSQRAQFSEGGELSIPVQLVREVASAYAQFSLDKRETASDLGDPGDEQEIRVDQKVEQEIAKIQSTTGHDYFTSRDLVFSANPKLDQEYKAFTLDISQGRI